MAPKPRRLRAGLAAGAGGARVGLALAGGGPLGAIYEIGALCALEEAVPALDLCALDGYVGVSAGSFIAAGLANGMTPRQLCASFIENDGPAADRIEPSLFFRPALAEFAQRLAALPMLALQAGWDYSVAGRPLLSALERLTGAVPTGLFSSTALQRRLAQVFSAPGRTNDFRTLLRERGRRLVLVATDLDSGEAAPFGQPGWDSVPIATAVAASAALPGLFPPLAIGSRWYVDGALKKTLHARVLLDMGVDLVLCVNPLVPFASGRGARHERVLGAALPELPPLVAGGLPLVLSQTFRTMIHSRLELGLKGYETSHPDTDILLFEPDHHDPALFLANTFGYSQRRLLAEHAYQHTRHELRARRGEIGALLARHGLLLDDAALDDRPRTLLDNPRRLRAARRGSAGSTPPRSRAARTLERLDEVLSDLEQRLAVR